MSSQLERYLRRSFPDCRGKCDFDILPPEILQAIISYLPPTDALSLCIASKHFFLISPSLVYYEEIRSILGKRSRGGAVPRHMDHYGQLVAACLGDPDFSRHITSLTMRFPNREALLTRESCWLTYPNIVLPPNLQSLMLDLPKQSFCPGPFKSLPRVQNLAISYQSHISHTLFCEVQPKHLTIFDVPTFRNISLASRRNTNKNTLWGRTFANVEALTIGLQESSWSRIVCTPPKFIDPGSLPRLTQIVVVAQQNGPQDAPPSKMECFIQPIANSGLRELVFVGPLWLDSDGAEQFVQLMSDSMQSFSASDLRFDLRYIRAALETWTLSQLRVIELHDTDLQLLAGCRFPLIEKILLVHHRGFPVKRLTEFSNCIGKRLKSLIIRAPNEHALLPQAVYRSEFVDRLARFCELEYFESIGYRFYADDWSFLCLKLFPSLKLLHVEPLAPTATESCLTEAEQQLLGSQPPCPEPALLRRCLEGRLYAAQVEAPRWTAESSTAPPISDTTLQNLFLAEADKTCEFGIAHGAHGIDLPLEEIAQTHRWRPVTRARQIHCDVIEISSDEE